MIFAKEELQILNKCYLMFGRYSIKKRRKACFG